VGGVGAALTGVSADTSISTSPEASAVSGLASAVSGVGTTGTTSAKVAIEAFQHKLKHNQTKLTTGLAYTSRNKRARERSTRSVLAWTWLSVAC
jgi:hypothetical protein